MSQPLRVLVVGLGTMGRGHAQAYANMPEFKIAAYCNRSQPDLKGLPEAAHYSDFHQALQDSSPDVVSINTWSDTHAEYAIAAMEAGAHVFVEKPLAPTLEQALAVQACAKRTGRKLVVGYILRVHPSWQRFIQEAQQLGGPWVFRMNLNQQSHGEDWAHHKALLESCSPIVDCGVHYLDVMCQVCPAEPVSVSAIYARLDKDTVQPNYGQLQIRFADGSVGWYEAGWGPMMSTAAHFVKDIISPNGSVTIAVDESAHDSADTEAHTRTSALRLHRREHPACDDEWIDLDGEPDHLALCEAEQRVLLEAIQQDKNTEQGVAQAVRSLAIALAADRSAESGRTIELDGDNNPWQT